jgi:hypothetical protein
LALPPNVTEIGDEARDGVEQRGLAGAVQSDDRDELSLTHMEGDVLQRLRPVIDDVQIPDIEERLRDIAKGGLQTRRGLEGAAEIDFARPPTPPWR